MLSSDSTKLRGYLGYNPNFPALFSRNTYAASFCRDA